MEPVNLHYIVNGDDFTAAGGAAGEIKRVLKSLGMNPTVIRKIAICVYEGEINMVIHADGGTADVDIDAEKVKVVLKDRGPGIPNISLAMQEGWSTAPEHVRDLGFGAGMGLPNMKKNSDEMTVESTVNVGTTVTMIVRL